MLTQESFVSDRVTYTYQYFRPDGLTTACPLWIGCPGGGSDGTEYLANSRADEAGPFAVAACDVGDWNAGGGWGNPKRDHIQMIRDLLTDVAKKDHLVDFTRVIMGGFSLGAIFCWRAAIELTDAISALAPMEGGQIYTGPLPSNYKPRPMVCFHGGDWHAQNKTGDGYYQFTKGTGPYSSAPNLPHPPIPNAWAWAWHGNAATVKVISTPLPNWTKTDYFQVKWPQLPRVTTWENPYMGHQISGGRPNKLKGPQQFEAQPFAVQMAYEQLSQFRL